VRPADQHLGGGDRANAGLGQQRRCHHAGQRAQLLAELGGLLVGGQGPLGGGPQRPHGRSILHRVAGLGGQGRAGPRLAQPRLAAKPGPQRLGRGHQQGLEVPAGVGGDLDGTGPGELEHPKGLALAALPRGCQVLATQRLAAGADRVQRVALGLGPAGPLGPVDLGHPLAMVGQEAGQPGAVAAGAFQRPAAAAPRPLDDQAQQLLIARLAARDLQLGQQPTVAVKDRGGVGIAVGVDPDDVVDLAF
jgi:hypothetical protein